MLEKFKYFKKKDPELEKRDQEYSQSQKIIENMPVDSHIKYQMELSLELGVCDEWKNILEDRENKKLTVRIKKKINQTIREIRKKISRFKFRYLR